MRVDSRTNPCGCLDLIFEGFEERFRFGDRGQAGATATNENPGCRSFRGGGKRQGFCQGWRKSLRLQLIWGDPDHCFIDGITGSGEGLEAAGFGAAANDHDLDWVED